MCLYIIDLIDVLIIIFFLYLSIYILYIFMKIRKVGILKNMNNDKIKSSININENICSTIILIKFQTYFKYYVFHYYIISTILY